MKILNKFSFICWDILCFVNWTSKTNFIMPLEAIKPCIGKLELRLRLCYLKQLLRPCFKSPAVNFYSLLLKAVVFFIQYVFHGRYLLKFNTFMALPAVFKPGACRPKAGVQLVVLKLLLSRKSVCVCMCMSVCLYLCVCPPPRLLKTIYMK